jgi:hypothetical protein
MEDAMKNLKTAVIIIAALVFTLPLAAPKDKDKDRIFESAWTPTAVQVDGAAADWAPESLYVWKDYNLSLGFKNDVNFLYLVAIFNDPKYVSSLDQTGMYFWINAEGKDKKTHGLHLFQRAVTADQLIAEMEKAGQTLSEDQKKELKKKQFYRLFACDVVNKKGVAVPHPGTGTGTYRYARSKTGATFEAVIPLALLNDPAAATKLDLSKSFKFGIEWGGMTEAMKKQRLAEVGDQGARATAGATNLEGQISGEHEGGGDFRSGESSLTGVRRGPKQYSLWINLKISEQK